MNPFDKFVAEIIRIEGGYVDDPDDSGGKTRYGITEALAREYGYRGDMRELPIEFAKYIYREHFWNDFNGNSMYLISPLMTFEMFDASVNHGVDRARGWLVSTLNTTNNRARLWRDIAAQAPWDDILMCLKQACARDAELVFKVFNIIRGGFYLSLATKKEANEKYIRGWLKRVYLMPVTSLQPSLQP